MEEESPKRANIHQREWVRAKVTRVPVDIVPREEGEVRAVVDFPKKHPTTFHPAAFTVKDVKIKMGDSDNSANQRELVEQQIEMQSQRFPDSVFTINVPYHFGTRESTYLFMTLKKERERMKLSFLDGFLSADEWVLNRNGVNMSMDQLIQYQSLLNDDKKKLKPNQQEFLQMLDDDYQ